MIRHSIIPMIRHSVDILPSRQMVNQGRGPCPNKPNNEI